MKRIQADEYDRPWLLLCEGEADRKFLQGLILDRNIPANFQVEFPSRDNDGGGRSKFGQRLKSLHSGVSETFLEIVKAVLVVSDNDDDPAASLLEVRNQLKLAGFPVPVAERMVAKKNGYPDTVILMLPPGGIGNLETLCLDAAYSKFDLKAQVDALANASPAKDWGVTKQSKMRVQSLIAATCRKWPDADLAKHWGAPPEYRFPLNHACFDDVAKFLKDFGDLLAAANA